jgi:hypothetical protein
MLHTQYRSSADHHRRNLNRNKRCRRWTDGGLPTALGIRMIPQSVAMYSGSSTDSFEGSLLDVGFFDIDVF